MFSSWDTCAAGNCTEAEVAFSIIKWEWEREETTNNKFSTLLLSLLSLYVYFLEKGSLREFPPALVSFGACGVLILCSRSSSETKVAAESTPPLPGIEALVFAAAAQRKKTLFIPLTHTH